MSRRIAAAVGNALAVALFFALAGFHSTKDKDGPGPHRNKSGGVEPPVSRAHDKAEELATTEGRAHSPGDPVNPQDPADQSPQSRPPWATKHLDDFNPNDPHPVAVEMIKERGWPKNNNGMVSARGLLFTTDGDMVHDTFKAGRGEADNRTDLKPHWANDKRMTTQWHAEGHAIATMQKYGIKDGVMYLNIPPCKTTRTPDGQVRIPCATTISHILPRGHTLTVWVVPQGGRLPYKQTYTGTGAGVENP